MPSELRMTPYAWCLSHSASPGDTVTMTERPPGEPERVTVFTITQIDEVAKRVTWSLPGVFEGVEWRGMDVRECEYELKGKVTA